MNNYIPYGRVLLADTQTSVRAIIDSWLKGQGCQVTTTSSGSHAWQAFQERPDDFDLVVMDYDLHDMDGPELSSRIKALRPQMPLILLAESSNTQDESFADSGPYALVINKPISMFGFLTSLEKLKNGSAPPEPDR